MAARVIQARQPAETALNGITHLRQGLSCLRWQIVDLGRFPNSQNINQFLALVGESIYDLLDGKPLAGKAKGTIFTLAPTVTDRDVCKTSIHSQVDHQYTQLAWQEMLQSSAKCLVLPRCLCNIARRLNSKDTRLHLPALISARRQLRLALECALRQQSEPLCRRYQRKLFYSFETVQLAS